MASTAANTAITNTVTVTYDNAAGVAQAPETASTIVTVTLVAAAPTLNSPGSIDPTTETTLNVLTYTIVSNANGPDSYTLTSANGIDANISAATLVVNGGAASNGDPVAGTAIALGGTTLAAPAPIGAGQITVPYDSNIDGDNLSTNGITSGDTIIIGGRPYQVAANGITENPATNVTTINIVGTILDAAGNLGDIIGEQGTFTVNVTTGTLTSGALGNHTIATTAASSADPAQTTTQGTATVITVRRPILGVFKYVQNVTTPVVGGGTSIGPLDTGGGAGTLTYYSQNISGQPGDILEYIIVIDNPAGSGMAQDVVIEDSVPQFTTYVDDSMRLDPGTGTFSGISDTSGDKDEGEYDNTVGSETIWIYAGSGGNDTGSSGVFGDGTGGDVNGGVITRGVFRVMIQ